MRDGRSEKGTKDVAALTRGHVRGMSEEVDVLRDQFWGYSLRCATLIMARVPSVLSLARTLLASLSCPASHAIPT